MKRQLKVVWAFDPFIDFKKTWKRSANVLAALSRTKKCEVQPVYVLGSEGLNWVTDLNITETDRFIPQITEAMLKVLRKLDLEHKVLPPKIVVSKKYSRRNDIKELLKFCDHWSADLILVNTHAREGVKRFFMGSFAETLLYHAKLPLLFVSPHTREVRNFRRVLFPTDFSHGSKRVLNVATECFKKVAKSFTIYNRIPYPIQAFSDAGVTMAGGGWLSVDEFISSDKKERERIAVPLSKVLRREGFQVDVEINEGDDRISDDILSASKKYKADLIVMGSEVNSFTQLLIGSMARNVIRESDLPVWVMHYPR